MIDFMNCLSTNEVSPSDGPDITDLVKQDLETRAMFGETKYGTRLKPNNGRDSLMDAYQEALDLACYLRQAIEERDSK